MYHTNNKNKPIFIILVILILLMGNQYSFAGEAVLSWDANTESDLSGYKVYYGTEPRSGGCPPDNYSQVANVGNVITRTVTDLSDGTTFYFSVTAYDTSQNESCFSNEVSKYIEAPPSDSIPPVISGIGVINITSSSVTINWTTDEPADTQIEYGTTASYGSNTDIISTLTTSHSQTITGLIPSTLYHYRVRSKDAAGNLGFSGNAAFTTDAEGTDPPTDPPEDTVSPIISEVITSSVTSTEAAITWKTNEPADSQIVYGLTENYGDETAHATGLVTSHSQTVSNLSPDTTYHYQVKSRDAAGNLALSGDKTFTTLSASDNIEPMISDINVSNITGSGVTITWTTDEISTSQVEYGTATEYGFSTTVDTELVIDHSQTLTGLMPDTLYHYRVKSRNASGNTGVSLDNIFTTLAGEDTTPPLDVIDFTATPGNSEIQLSWTNPDDPDFIGVRIRFRTDGEYPVDETDGQLVADFTGQSGDAGSYLHTGLQNGTTYYYSAFSYDASGNYSNTAFTSATPENNERGDSGGDKGGGGIFGCGSIKDHSGSSGPNSGQIALNLAILALPVILVRIWWLLRMKMRRLNIV